jgi:hypothetical protein
MKYRGLLRNEETRGELRQETRQSIVDVNWLEDMDKYSAGFQWFNSLKLWKLECSVHNTFVFWFFSSTFEMVIMLRPEKCGLISPLKNDINKHNDINPIPS